MSLLLLKELIIISLFVNLLIQRMKDHFLIEWKDGINSNRKLCDYVYFKVHFGYEMF